MEAPWKRLKEYCFRGAPRRVGLVSLVCVVQLPSESKYDPVCCEATNAPTDPPSPSFGPFCVRHVWIVDDDVMPGKHFLHQLSHIAGVSGLVFRVKENFAVFDVRRAVLICARKVLLRDEYTVCVDTDGLQSTCLCT